MTLQYRHRLVAHYGRDQQELARFRRAPTESEIKYWTAGVEHWEHETVLTDRETITARPVVQPYRAPRVRTKLTDNERAAVATAIFSP